MASMNFKRLDPLLYSSFFSAFIHFILFFSLVIYTSPSNSLKKKQDVVSVEILEKVKPKPIPKKKIIKKAKKKPKIKKSTLQKSSKKKKKKVAPIQGLKKSSFSKQGTSGFVAPVGNSIMEEDKGIRRSEVEDLDVDLSARAKLLEFLKPAYTQDAVDGELEGRFLIDVFIDKEGRVLEAELRKKIGFGMDNPLLQSALKARYEARKNRSGVFISGWDVIEVLLTIP